ncbi:hypothetical protein ABZ297_10145 [Nonomuraea sp. NPDC005983]
MKTGVLMERLLPAIGGKGRPWCDYRQLIDGIVGRLPTGAP